MVQVKTIEYALSEIKRGTAFTNKKTDMPPAASRLHIRFLLNYLLNFINYPLVCDNDIHMFVMGFHGDQRNDLLL